MAGSTIEAKLRIALQVAEAIAGLKNFRKELSATKADAAKAAGAGAAGAAGDPQTTEAINQVKKRSTAERDAAAERKRLDKEEADRKKALANDAKRTAEDEDRQRRKVLRETERARREQEVADKKAARQKSYTSAALAPQLNDIFVGATTGQSPLTVALQQGPQIVQIYGGVRNTFAAALSVLTPLRVALGLTVVGFATLAVQMAAGYRESSQLNKALALSGNIANTSLAQINGLAVGISERQRSSVAFVREVLAQVISLAGQTDTTLSATSSAVVALAKLTGQSADEAVKGFENQADGITQWSVKANKAYNFLTAQQVAYIRSLERQGRIAEAIKYTNEQLADSLKQRSGPAIGALERGWNDFGNELARVLDLLKALGRDDTAEEKLKKLKDQVNGENGQGIFKNLGEGLKFGLLGGGATEAGRAYLDQIKARNKAEADAAQSQFNSDAKRRTEAAADIRAEQDRIAREAKEFQQLLAGQRAADAQLSLAKREAQLDAERGLVDRANSQELLSASDLALKLNAIDQQRALAQQALAERLLQIEGGRTKSLDSKNEVEAQKAQLTQLQAQLVSAKARVATAVSEGKSLIDAEIKRLDEELRSRTANNLDARAERAQDPQERARLAAEAATADARRQFELLQRDVRSRQASQAGLSGNEDIQLRQQAVIDEARKTLDELTRRAKLDSLGREAAELQQTLALREREIDQMVEQSSLTTEEAERRKIEARAQALPQLKELLLLQQALAQTRGENNALGQLVLQLDQLQDKSTEVARTLKGSLQSGFAEMFSSVLTGSKSGLDAVKGFVSGVAKSMLDLIGKRLGEQLVNSLFASSSGTGGAGSVFAQLLAKLFSSGGTATVNHTGGVIGGAGGAVRAIAPALFAGAQILHGGGIAGVMQYDQLGSNERRAILEVGEEVLPEDNPRHIKNFRGNGVNITMGVTINGANGQDQDQLGQLDRLQQMMRTTVEQWAAEQRRQGGMLSGVRGG